MCSVEDGSFNSAGSVEEDHTDGHGKRNKSGRFLLTALVLSKVAKDIRSKTGEAEEKLERDSHRITYLLFNKQG